MAAVMAASQKPLVGQALAEIHKVLEQVPDDVDWMGFNAGVMRYQGMAPRAPRAEYPVLKQVGRVTLRDAGGSGKRGTGNGLGVMVVVPSMVNRGYVLDLWPGHSMVDFFRAQGWRVLIVDWDDPTVGMDAPLTVEEIIAGRLVPLVQHAREVAGGPVQLFGYCMGGLLALGAAVLLGKEVVEKLAVAAMPWDFSVTPSSGHMQALRPMMEPWLTGQEVIPAAMMQQYFWLLDPWSPVKRLAAYGREMDLQRLAYLTALEDWLADGLALDAPIGREILMDWYADNRTLKGQWKVSGQVVVPDKLAMPLWVGITQKDVLVPTACSLPLVGQSNGAVVHMAQTGHVGLVCGRRAEEQFYAPLQRWLKEGL